MLDAPLTTPAASRDAITRYARATSPDGWLTADGWLRLADDLDAEAGHNCHDPRGPYHRAVAVDGHHVTLDCGHVCDFASHFSYRVGDRHNCFACGQMAAKLHDRAADCRQRAAALTRGAL